LSHRRFQPITTCFLFIKLKPKHQGFKANATTRELNTSAHQKHEPTCRLQSRMIPLSSGAVNSHTANFALLHRCYRTDGIVISLCTN